MLAGGIEGEHSGETEEGGHRETGDGYDLKPFRLAVVEGTHPGGKSLSSNMPRWNVSDEDLTDLVVLLFLLFGGGMATSAMVSGGIMGGGMMGGISWMWIPTLLTLGLGVLLGWVIWGKK